MFQPLLPYLSSEFDLEVISFPITGSQSYSSLLPFVQNLLPKDMDFVLLAESFSGPLAVEIAARNPKNLKGLILYASFLSSPRYIPPLLRSSISTLLFKLPRWSIFIKYFLLGFKSDPRLVSLLKDALSEISPATLASRLLSIFESNVTSLMSKVSVPILYLYPTNDRLIPQSTCKSIKSFGVKSIGISGPHCILQSEPQRSSLHIKEYCNTLRRWS